MSGTTMAEYEAALKIHLKIKSLDDDDLWEGFDWDETDKILSGEIKPKTLITTYLFGYTRQKPQKGTLIAEEMLSVFPNSKYMNRRRNSELGQVIKFAKKKGFTSLILAHTNNLGNDEIRIINLLNGASASFIFIELVPRIDIPNCAKPPSRRYPRLHVRGFDSPASVGTARMIQSLFPKVPHSRRPSRLRSIAWLEQQRNHVFFRHHRLCSEEVIGGERSSVSTQPQECGPRFTLKLMGVDRVSLDTGNMKLIGAADPDGG
ncbi:hypothetical protein CARUB_v10023871mg [Capsella rubella]|uniref:Brix domain-containing protein n=1 Tax=Capsella rubella TaxID=81985 RepID=R0HUE5_9BRAS|nr:ribosome production factor 1 [Capsella rubella]EOA27718.1 hypothetical protein CARUB_v10023871mg [Capsella rubella]